MTALYVMVFASIVALATLPTSAKASPQGPPFSQVLMTALYVMVSEELFKTSERGARAAAARFCRLCEGGSGGGERGSIMQRMASSAGVACGSESLPLTGLCQACQASCQGCQASELQKFELRKSEFQSETSGPAQLPSLLTQSKRPPSQTSAP